MIRRTNAPSNTVRLPVHTPATSDKRNTIKHRFLIGARVSALFFAGYLTVATFFFAPHQFQKNSNSSASNSISNNIASSYPPQDLTTKAQHLTSASVNISKPFAYIPLESYNACNDRIKHLSCLKTVIADDAGSVKFLPDLADEVCDQLLQSFSSNILNEGHAMVCLQVGSIVGSVVELKGKTNELPEILRFVLPSETQSVLASLGSPTTARVVDRAVAIVHALYIPRSKESNEARAKNGNLGNLIWSFGVTRLINPFTTTFVHDKDAKYEQGKAFVIATANLFNLNDVTSSDGYVNNLSGKVQRFNLPTIMLGAGIQADFSLIKSFAGNDVLRDSHRKLLRLLAERTNTKSVAVRGNLTETACMNAGFNHCIALGCPSLTINRSLNLGRDLQQKWDKTIAKLERKEEIKLGLVLPAPGVNRTEANKNLTPTLGKIYSRHNDTYFILQTPYDRLAALKIAEKSDIKMFDNVEEWTEFTASLDLVISTRIHGSMAAISVGTPAVVIPTDFRIMELANAMQVPTLPMENFSEDIMKSLKFVQNDFISFEANRKEKIAKYLSILNGVGLELDPQLLAIHNMAK